MAIRRTGGGQELVERTLAEINRMRE